VPIAARKRTECAAVGERRLSRAHWFVFRGHDTVVS